MIIHGRKLLLKSKENINFNSTICQYYSGVVVGVNVKVYSQSFI